MFDGETERKNRAKSISAEVFVKFDLGCTSREAIPSSHVISEQMTSFFTTSQLKINFVFLCKFCYNLLELSCVSRHILLIDSVSFFSAEAGACSPSVLLHSVKSLCV